MNLAQQLLFSGAMIAISAWSLASCGAEPLAKPGRDADGEKNQTTPKLQRGHKAHFGLFWDTFEPVLFPVKGFTTKHLSRKTGKIPTKTKKLYKTLQSTTK